MRYFLPLFPLYFGLVALFLASALGGPSKALHDKRLPGLLYRLTLFPFLIITALVLLFYGFGWLLGESKFFGATFVAFALLLIGLPTLVFIAMKLAGNIAKAFQPKPVEKD